MKLKLSVGLLVFLIACSDDTTSVDAGLDAGVDAPTRDTSARDTNGQDTNRPDTTSPDTGGSDTGTDTGGTDAGQNGAITGVMTAEAQDLYDRIMAYRATAGLPSIPASEDLTRVAQSHVWDSYTNNPAQGNCNLHSWSNTPPWTGCCYTPDHAAAQCMWDKPREISSYSGNGYEISARSSGTLTPESALSLWQGSPGHNNVIMNRAPWTQPWGAIGVAIDGGYAHVWFGREAQ